MVGVCTDDIMGDAEAPSESTIDMGIEPEGVPGG